MKVWMTLVLGLLLLGLGPFFTAWVINQLVSQQFLQFVFGVSHMDYWRALLITLLFMPSSAFKQTKTAD